MTAVLDASALLALLGSEPGGERVASAVAAGALIGAANLSEVVAKLVDGGVPQDEAVDALAGLGLQVPSFDQNLAYLAGSLRPATRSRGLSLGDRACLALGLREGLPVLTADRHWEGLVAGLRVEFIR